MSVSLKRAGALLLLAVLPIFFFWKLTLAGRILVGLDPFNFFYPYHDAVAAALAAGRLPEWNPALFGGVPFLADPQAQLFYPLGWPFLWVDAPSSLTWQIVLHLGLAALGTYTWARRGLGLDTWGAWVAGFLFSLGGYVTAQVEHLNQVQAAAWLPFLLLGYELARRARPGEVDNRYSSAPDGWRRRGILLGAVALGMSFLAGHTQTTFISLVALGLWGLWSMIQYDCRAWPSRLRHHGPPLVAILLLGGLTASVQLWPTQRLSTLSTRAGGMTFWEATSFSLDPRLLLRALLPTYGLGDYLLSEYVGWIGFLGLALVVIGLIRPAQRLPRDFGLLLSAAGLLLALGKYNPLFWVLWRLVPGFDLFRAPARWLLLWALGLAVLAGVGMEQLRSRERNTEEGPHLPMLRTTLHPWPVRLLLVLSGLAGMTLLAIGDWPRLQVLPLWTVGLVGALLVVRFARRWPDASPFPYAPFVVLLLVLELWTASWGQNYQDATAASAYLGMRPAPAHLITQQRDTGASRLLSWSHLLWVPSDTDIQERRYGGVLGEKAIYDLLVSLKLKDILAPNQPMRWGLQSADGYGGGLLPTSRWVRFQKLLPLAKVVPDGRLREQLTGMPRPALLNVMGVERLITDKLDDWWVEQIHHDLSVPYRLSAGETIEREIEEWDALNGISFVVRGDWPADPGVIRIGEQAIPLDRAQELDRRETERGVERRMWLPVDPPVNPERLEVIATSPWTLCGLTLVDTRLPAFQALPAHPDVKITLSGDVKVYRRTDAPGRAWVAPGAVSVDTMEEAATIVGQERFNPLERIVVEQAGAGPLPSGGAGHVRWLEEEPGSIRMRVTVPEGGWLVLADAPFPGWRAVVNGKNVDWQAANLINRALYLPPGEHVVEWRYRTPGLRVGLAGTVLGLLLLALVLAFPRRR